MTWMFIAPAVLLCLIAAAFVVLPWWRANSAPPDRREALASIVRDRLAELERDRAAGLIDDAAWSQLKREQERRFLAESEPLAPSRGSRMPRWWLVLPALAIPLLAIGLYVRLGGMPDWHLQSLLEQAQRQAAAQRDNSAALVALREALVARIPEVDDEDGRRRVLLARLELETGNFAGAVEQYRALYRQFPEDAAAAAQLAQALYLANGRRPTAEIEGLARAAVAMEPGQTTALGLLGIAAFERGEFGEAIAHWQQLQAQLPANSPEHAVIGRGIAEARQRGGGELEGPALDITVEIAPELAATLPESPVLFVFAREAGGAPMPLAAARLQPSSWPVKVRLDETSAMAPGASLAAVGKVDVVARISRSGEPRPMAGDLEGSATAVELGGKPVPLTLTIDRQL